MSHKHDKEGKHKHHKHEHNGKHDGDDHEDRAVSLETFAVDVADEAEPHEHPHREKFDRRMYEKELVRLQVELVKMQEWIKAQGLKVVILFEGRDAAGKGGAIKTITDVPESALLRASSPSARRRSARRRSGISSATRRICPPPARWCCSIGVGTIARASSA